MHVLLLFLSSFLFLFVVSCRWVFLTSVLTGFMMELILAVGSAVGFHLQFYEFFTYWSVEGFFSLGLTAMDITGCAWNAVSLFGKTNPPTMILHFGSFL